MERNPEIQINEYQECPRCGKNMLRVIDIRNGEIHYACMSHRCRYGCVERIQEEPAPDEAGSGFGVFVALAAMAFIICYAVHSGVLVF